VKQGLGGEFAEPNPTLAGYIRCVESELFHNTILPLSADLGRRHGRHGSEHNSESPQKACASIDVGDSRFLAVFGPGIGHD
jgi:hypothetical protein